MWDDHDLRTRNNSRPGERTSGACQGRFPLPPSRDDRGAPCNRRGMIVGGWNLPGAWQTRIGLRIFGTVTRHQARRSWSFAEARLAGSVRPACDVKADRRPIIPLEHAKRGPAPDGCFGPATESCRNLRRASMVCRTTHTRGNESPAFTIPSVIGRAFSARRYRRVNGNCE